MKPSYAAPAALLTGLTACTTPPPTPIVPRTPLQYERVVESTQRVEGHNNAAIEAYMADPSKPQECKDELRRCADENPDNQDIIPCEQHERTIKVNFNDCLPPIVIRQKANAHIKACLNLAQACGISEEI